MYKIQTIHKHHVVTGVDEVHKTSMRVPAMGSSVEATHLGLYWCRLGEFTLPDSRHEVLVKSKIPK